MERIWNTLYKEAKNKLKTQEISPFIEYGNNVCAILASNDKVYTGISISSDTELDCSAEKNAVSNMFNDNEHKIKKIVILNELEEVITPSEDSFEFLLELCDDINTTEVLIDYEEGIVKKIVDLIPAWWGTLRSNK